MFLHVLYDLLDFHTKSLFLVFNFWEAENLLFLIFNVSGPSGTQIGKGKIAQLVFLRENGVGKGSKRESFDTFGPKLIILTF